MSSASRAYFDDWQAEVFREPYHLPLKRHTEEPQMANVNDLAPSKWLKAADLKGKRLKLMIDRVDMEKLGDDRKPVMYFVGKDKGVVLNKTNLFAIASGHGDETDDWHGKEVIIYGARVSMQGQMVDAIRMDPVVPVTESLDDEVPF